MPNKTITRFLAVLVCLGILAMSAPGLSSAVKAKGKINLVQLVKQPVLTTSLLVTVVDPAVVAKSSTKSGVKVRPTGDLPVPTPGTGD
jgi:hypothetical protein